MSNVQSDAFVFFGATGDLAYKKIFPALQAMVFLTAEFSQAPRHLRRLSKVAHLELQPMRTHQ